MDEITMQERFVQANLPAAPTGGTLTAARDVQEGDTITQGRGSRYQGPTFVVAHVEKVPGIVLIRPLAPTMTILGVTGERMTNVPLDFAYYVTKKGIA